MIRTSQAAFRRMAAAEQVFIAYIAGHALGGGLEIALACDLRYASEGRYKLGTPEVTLGLLPGNGGTQRLTRLIGPSRAMDLLLTGRTFGPDEALQWGLVTELCDEAACASGPSGSPRGPALAVAAIKRCVHEGGQLPLDEGLALEAELMEQLFRSKDATEGLTAFVEKRAPEFVGRMTTATGHRLDDHRTRAPGELVGEVAAAGPGGGRRRGARRARGAAARGAGSATRTAARSCTRARRPSRRTSTSSCPILVAEQGKTIREAKIELHKAADTLEHYAGHAEGGPRRLRPRARRRRRRPRAAPPARRGGGDRAVELPDDAAVQQARAGAAVRQHRRRQARRLDAADDAAPRRDPRARPGCPRACSPCSRARAPRRARRS